jgi:hypothetical protein
LSHTPREAVVLIPGLWIPAWSLWLQARRLRRGGYVVHVFRWRTVRRDFSENALALQTFLATVESPTVHLVGYSLGGILIRALHHYFPAQRPGRRVTWGAPHAGSRAAARLARFALGRLILGRSIADLLANKPDGWTPPPAGLGTLAGVFPCGLGALIARLPRPHDGVVALDETRCRSAVDSVTLKVSHYTMLWSRAVADQTCAFLCHGRFIRGGG